LYHEQPEDALQAEQTKCLHYDCFL